jgi:DNA-binding CsgD family transcriptional regulator
MSDTNAVPEGKQDLAARIIRTILVYAMEMPVGNGPSSQAGNHVEPGAHERALISHYGLTREEASLAVRFVRGRSLEEAAEELCISSTVARTLLRRIFMKAQIHSCVETGARHKSTLARSSQLPLNWRKLPE